MSDAAGHLATSAIRTGRPVAHRLRRGQRDRQGGAGVLPADRRRVAGADGVDERGQLGHVGAGQQRLVAARRSPPSGRPGRRTPCR